MVLAALAGPVAWACGPFFGERLLVDRAASLRSAPRARLDDEVKAMRVPAPALAASWAADGPEAPDEVYREQNRAVDLAELALALGNRPDRAAVLRRYETARAELARVHAAPNARGGRVPGSLRPPAGLPPEFSDYFEGALAWEQGDRPGARKAWERLLARPAAERRAKSTSATFMLGRLLATEDPAAAKARFRQTRELVPQGFRDPLGLGAASLGQEARLLLADERFADAARLYLEACTLGDPAAPSSLRFLSWRLLGASEATRASALRDPLVRRVLVAHLVSSSQTSELAADSTEAKILTMLLDSTRGEHDVEGADRLAWIAYQRNDLATADTWLDRAKADLPIVAWLRSKQLARKGKLTEAAGALTRATAAFPLAPGELPLHGVDEFEVSPPDLSRQLRAELGVIELGRGHYTEALDLLMRAGQWRDAAHVAERVLTIDELRVYVDRNWPEPAAGPTTPAPPASPPQPDDEVSLAGHSRGAELRYLLARRMARQNRWPEARPYLPVEMRPYLDLYLREQGIARGQGTARARSAALWVMAQLERKKGIELLGTELGPDWAVDGGSFDEDVGGAGPMKLQGPLVRGDERRRVKASAPAFASRFHYRRIAVDRALEASRLLPDGDDQIGAMLCEAAGWIATREPRVAAKVTAEARRRRSACPAGVTP